MVQKLRDIRGGLGSIRIESIGTISSLMNRELESSSSLSHVPSSSRRSQPPPASVSCSDNTLKLRTSMDEAQSSGTSNIIKQRTPENIRRTRGQNQLRVPVLGPTSPKRQKQQAYAEEASSSRDLNRRTPELPWKTRSHKRTHDIPMLGAENIAIDKTPKRDKPVRKVSIVEVVDTNCGVPAGSLSNRLKKLGFSKLSQSII